MPATITWTGRHVAKQLRAQLVQHHVPRKWSGQVLGQTEFHELSVECNLPVVADDGDPNVRRADARQSFQFGDGILNLADVSDQSGQVGVGFEHPYRVSNVPTLDQQIAAFEPLA